MIQAWLKKKAIRRFLHTCSKIEYGTLALVTPDEERLVFRGPKEGPEATLTIKDWRALFAIASRGDVGLGEAYVEGLWHAEKLDDFLTLCLMNMRHFEGYAHGHMLARIEFWFVNVVWRGNSKMRSPHNIRSHYDTGNAFYRLWLDETMTYSSGLYEGQGRSLKEAQEAKYTRILQKLGNSPKEILEIGCGWGGFAEMASRVQHRVTGLTLSAAQFDYATARLKDKANILVKDYRDVTGLFDAIVSIEMFEAVGERYWPAYFRTVKERLKSGGNAVIQTITIADEEFADYRKRGDYLRQYTFPGGMLASRQRFVEEAERAGLAVKDVFEFGQDYARTLKEWLHRLDLVREEIFKLGYSEAFLRSWRFYLASCIAAFTVGRTNVIQIELAHAGR